MADRSHWREHTQEGLLGVLGPLLTRQIEGHWQYGLHISEAHLNIAKHVHGGTIMTLLDQALSALAWQYADRTTCVTVQLNINFISGAKMDDLLIATGKVVKQTGSLLFLEGQIQVSDVTVATAQGIFKRV